MLTTLTINGRERVIGRAPKGGIEYNGKTYRAGQFVPAAAFVPPVRGGAPEQELVTLEITLERNADLPPMGFLADSQTEIKLGDRFGSIAGRVLVSIVESKIKGGENVKLARGIVWRSGDGRIQVGSPNKPTTILRVGEIPADQANTVIASLPAADREWVALI